MKEVGRMYKPCRRQVLSCLPRCAWLPRSAFALFSVSQSMRTIGASSGGVNSPCRIVCAAPVRRRTTSACKSRKAIGSADARRPAGNIRDGHRANPAAESLHRQQIGPNASRTWHVAAASLQRQLLRVRRHDVFCRRPEGQQHAVFSSVVVRNVGRGLAAGSIFRRRGNP